MRPIRWAFGAVHPAARPPGLALWLASAGVVR
ncbi:hypothetical protein FB384_002686 [Prauserella sediminis]|uniref:Uncharacterized protein n=1 Tax=Prauserella sediminis TaxID=577680 RepID=A0A839XIK0_9PSEU|nr:hypothetical protein [Prauserella sediminis]